jgi:hypothetical protein
MYAVYEGIKHGNRFISSLSTSEEEACKIDTGEVAYRILHKAPTIEECQAYLFGDNNQNVNYSNEQRDLLVKFLNRIVHCGALESIYSQLSKGEKNLVLHPFDKKLLAVCITMFLKKLELTPQNDFSEMEQLELRMIYYTLMLT